MIPDYQTLMLPLLDFIKDGQTHNTQNAVDFLAKKFNLSEEELNEWLPSKKQKTFSNRVHWAKAYLKMADAIENIRKGIFKITERGLSILKSNPSSINVKYLIEMFPDFEQKINKFRYQKKNSSNFQSLSVPETSVQTPEEEINISYQKIRDTLEQEILSKLKSVHPSFFEKIVVELLVKMGYGGLIEEAGKVTRYTNDEGIDGIIKEDKLGLDIIYIQAKKWEPNVGRPEIQKFVGALAGKGAKKGIFITTSDYSKEAIEYIPKNDTKIVLINGEELASLMIDHNLGVSTQETYEIKKIDSDYFEEE